MRLLWEACGGPATVTEELEILSDVRRPSSLCASNQTATPSRLCLNCFFPFTFSFRFK